MREAVIVAAARTAVGKAIRGSTRNARSDDMAAAVIADLLRQTSHALDPQDIDDVVIGCAMPEGAQGMNFARVIALRAGLPVDTPGQTVNRFCSSGLQTIALAANSIIADQADVVIAGGAESMSSVPMTGHHLSPNPHMAENAPNVYMSMGLTAERVASEFGVSRADMDEFAYNSHHKAAAATDAGYFAQEIVPFQWQETTIGADGRPTEVTKMLERDEHLRRETTIDALAKLKPVFKAGGKVTAGNSSPLSDGAAAVLVMERAKAEQLGLQPLARFVGFAVAGVRPEIMGVGPIKAVPKLLQRAGMSLDAIDLIELNEAFAAQALAVMRELEMDPARVNVNGGAIALGHPLGCTGAKLTVQLINEMKRRGGDYGMVTMCIGGGMGAAGLFQNLN
ncbi:MAG: acetyl-CoA C-acyltransferase [Chloroflexi bacterium]|nr:acetyl-CoA C-acyltransferase [Chloroflexota bacterium]MXX82076.1 acetyl-CoA C-acyltransferase [Chloroflexota bacterium]MYA92908.1 acetyl-CoA C-acyltransferase [Chloroflexota bacterium]MYC56326.1 acetyl-CoA C-acyltransferase [Chloroflexota bacterium]MYD38522.1 acetyl-CoA C-acyltransferase [Chloroflexota bacterium]